MSKKATTYIKQLVIPTLSTFILISTFEAIKSPLCPDITTGESHTLTIFFTTALMFVSSFFVFLNNQKISKTLTENEAKFRALVDNLPLGISLVNNKLEVLFLNKLMYKWFPTADLYAKPLCYGVFNSPPRSEPCTYCPTIKTIADGTSHVAITETPSPNGTINFRLSATPLFDNDNNIYGAIEVVEDITETYVLKQHEAQLHAQLIHSDRLASIGILAAGIAHEINNPLTIIMGSLDLLKSKCKDVCGSSCPIHLDRSSTACARIATIVAGLRTMARSDSVVLEQIDVHATINEIQDVVKNIFEKEEVLITTNFACEKPLIKANSGQLQQVILNLLTNAKDAIKEKCPKGTITISTTFTPTHVTIAIADTGVGMDPDQLNKVFEPFYTTKPVGKGTGLGLPISKSIIESFGGTITINSTIGLGTTFNITLPLV